VVLHDAGDARQRPACSAKAMGTGALAQEGEKVLALFQTECGLTAPGMGLGVEPCRRLPRHGIAPAPEGTGRGLDVSGHLTDAPAGLQEGDSDAASDFALDRCALRSHETRIGRIALGL
jgi:hypothetical protein